MAGKTARKPVQARSEATKARILEVARHHFAERGFEAANTRDIANDADASHAMIRYHFGTKDNLWREAVADMFQRLRKELGFENGTPPELNTINGYREFLRRYIYYCARHPEHARIMISESVRGGERLHWMVENFIQPGHAVYAGPTKKHMDNGDLPSAWHPSLIFMITSICQMPFVLAAEAQELYGVDMLSDSAIEAHIDSVLAFLLRDPSRMRSDWPALPDWLTN
ncbi:hypothetical protein HY29_01060 [Hyphomonas beringensis]|uniref:HTH tetR-type domain-containing protein n=1 Tax=Hyphomonas beringensis TaxID=1280946 RepID=A0A062UMK7_9PROT|nr:TetR/AcrR family transcriptional regulator [Hyphomonas beringensis]KCZ57345.1 hypothetical protein HY29_01060 [Hyphomonas beringensis]